MAKDMKVIVESVHLILTLFNWSDKLLLESRQCSIFLEMSNVCHYASKGILFLVSLAEVFPTIHWFIVMFMDWPLCASRHWARSGGWGGGRGGGTQILPSRSPHSERWESRGRLKRKQCIYLGITLFFLWLRKWKCSKL